MGASSPEQRSLANSAAGPSWAGAPPPPPNAHGHILVHRRHRERKIPVDEPHGPSETPGRPSGARRVQASAERSGSGRAAGWREVMWASAPDPSGCWHSYVIVLRLSSKILSAALVAPCTRSSRSPSQAPALHAVPAGVTSELSASARDAAS